MIEETERPKDVVTAEDAITIDEKRVSHTGWNAMYDSAKRRYLDEGVVLVSAGPRIFVFQISKMLDLFDPNDFIFAIPGSVMEVINGDFHVNSISDNFNLGSLRFPTKTELELYDKMATI